MSVYSDVIVRRSAACAYEQYVGLADVPLKAAERRPAAMGHLATSGHVEDFQITQIL